MHDRGDAHRQGDRFAREPVRRADAIPALMRLAEIALHGAGEAQP